MQYSRPCDLEFDIQPCMTVYLMQIEIIYLMSNKINEMMSLPCTVVDLLPFFQGGNLNKQRVVSLMWLAARHFGMVLTPS